jgi:hypothetical protein
MSPLWWLFYGESILPKDGSCRFFFAGNYWLFKVRPRFIVCEVSVKKSITTLARGSKDDLRNSYRLLDDHDKPPVPTILSTCEN